MRYIKGLDRHQSLMFPELLDEYLAENNNVRFIDALVDGLNLIDLGFTHSSTSKTGRKPYNPGDLFKLYLAQHSAANKIIYHAKPQSSQSVTLYFSWRSLSRPCGMRFFKIFLLK